MLLPDTYSVVPEQNDIGKRVIVNSVGGALKNIPGVVIFGPYTFTIAWLLKDKKRKGRTRTLVNETSSYWKVLLDGCNLELDFTASELVF